MDAGAESCEVNTVLASSDVVACDAVATAPTACTVSQSRIMECKALRNNITAVTGRALAACYIRIVVRSSSRGILIVDISTASRQYTPFQHVACVPVAENTIS